MGETSTLMEWPTLGAGILVGKVLPGDGEASLLGRPARGPEDDQAKSQSNKAVVVSLRSATMVLGRGKSDHAVVPDRVT